MDIMLTTCDFEGPLDLLLHLVKENKMDLLNIKVEVIIDQYLDFINRMESMNLNVASSYLIMASELIELKSKLLLPSRKEDDELEEDTEENLVNRLIEYQRYKDLTSEFKKLESERSEIYTKLPSNLKEYIDPSIKMNMDVSLEDLISAFQKFLDRKKLERPLNTKITKKEITVEERVTLIRNVFKNRRKANFFEFFDVLTKEYVVVTFLAILEMVKEKEIHITQDEKFGDIICEVCYE